MTTPTARFTGIFIPVEILECEDLTPTETILLSWIDALFCKEHGGCYASNEYLAKRLKVMENTIAKSLTKFRKLGLIEDVSFNGRHRVIRSTIGKFIDQRQSKADLDLNPKQGWIKIQGSVGQKSKAPIKDIPYIETKEDIKEDKNIAQTSQSESELGDDISFSKEEKRFLRISEKDLEDWKQIYTFIDIDAEILKAEQWILSNPSRAKKKLWRKFLTTWFQKNNDHRENKAAYRSSQAAQANNASQSTNDRSIDEIALVAKRARICEMRKWAQTILKHSKVEQGKIKILDDCVKYLSAEGWETMSFLSNGFVDRFKNIILKNQDYPQSNPT